MLSGKGEYFDDGAVAAAQEAVPTASDLGSTSPAIAGPQWRCDITDVMQALQAADDMFADDREGAQGAVMDSRMASAPTRTMPP